MVILIDPPTWPGHGRLWSHLVSDDSFHELHAFADRIGLPPRGFERDHYDIPSHLYETAIAAGALPVGSRELLRRLTAAGLRRPKRARRQQQPLSQSQSQSQSQQQQRTPRG